MTGLLIGSQRAARLSNYRENNVLSYAASFVPTVLQGYQDQRNGKTGARQGKLYRQQPNALQQKHLPCAMWALSFRSSAFAVKSAQRQKGDSERQQRAATGSVQASQRAARACLKGGIFALGHEGGFFHVSDLP